MIITKKALSRRTVLRGIGVSLALPYLDAMVPALSAVTTKPAQRLQSRPWQSLQQRRPHSTLTGISPFQRLSAEE